MKLWVFSDLHLAFSSMETPLAIPDADICVVAGDIHVRGPERSIAWLGEHVCPHMPVVFVAGNHEFYHSSIVEGIANGMVAAARFPNLHFLENGFVEIFGVWFFGATLWTDFDIMGSRALAMDHAEQVMNDYRQIAYSKNPYMRLRSYHTSRRHWETRRWLTAFLDSRRPEKTVVVTHHAPSWQAIAPEYKIDITSAGFASNMETLIHEFRPSSWVHGHVHTRLDYEIGSTRLICNPRGYPGERSYGKFDPTAVIEI